MNEPARNLLRALRQAAVPEIENLQRMSRFEVGRAARVLWQDISDAAALGDPDATEAMNHVGSLGCQKVLADDKRAIARGVFVVKHRNGATSRRDSQLLRGVTKTDAATGERYVQQGIWWSFTYEEMSALYAGFLRQFARLAEKKAMFARVMAAYEAHPTAATAADACRLAGFDPGDIEITDIDIQRARAA